METVDRRTLLAGAGLLGAAALARRARSGPLDPPDGPVSPTYKTLDQVEPRTPVQSLPGSGTAVRVISQPGSYYLTADVQGETGKHGIEIGCDGVTLDLGGFVLSGGAGTVDGIHVTPGDRRNCAIVNGAMHSWGRDGVHLTDAHTFLLDRVRAVGCAGHGFACGQGGAVTECVASRNGLDGFDAAWRNLFVNCVAQFNERAGFNAYAELTAIACQAENNVAEGFTSYFGGHYSDCASISNSRGFAIVTWGHIVNCSAKGSLEHGFIVVEDCTVTGCTATHSPNGFFTYGSGSTFDSNRALDCGSRGFWTTAGGNLLIRNTVRGSGTAFSLAPGESHGPIVNVAGAGDIAGVSGADHPWANFVY